MLLYDGTTVMAFPRSMACATTFFFVGFPRSLRSLRELLLEKRR